MPTKPPGESDTVQRVEVYTDAKETDTSGEVGCDAFDFDARGVELSVGEGGSAVIDVGMHYTLRKNFTRESTACGDGGD